MPSYLKKASNALFLLKQFLFFKDFFKANQVTENDYFAQVSKRKK